MKAVAFDIYGTHAHFKAWYMTTSRTTYPLPPRTALAGIVGAIMGVERENLPIQYAIGNGNRFGVRSLKAVETRILAVKGLRGPAVLKVGGKKQNRQIEVAWLRDDAPPRIPFEVIDQPKYRIYVQLSTESEMNDLRTRIEESRPNFRPYLGTANMVAYLSNTYLDFEVIQPGEGTGRLGGLLPKEAVILNIQELRREKVRLTEVVAQKVVTEDLAYQHGEFLMDIGAVGIPGALVAERPYVIDDGLTIPLI